MQNNFKITLGIISTLFISLFIFSLNSKGFSEDLNIGKLKEIQKNKLAVNFSSKTQDVILLDTIFDCLNEFTIYTYYNVIKSTEDTPNCLNKLLEDDKTKTFLSDRYIDDDKSLGSLYDFYSYYEKNLKNTICIDSLIDAEGNESSLSEICQKEISLNGKSGNLEKQYLESVSEYEKNANENISCDLSYISQIAEISKKENIYLVCNGYDYYKISTDILFNIRNILSNIYYKDTRLDKYALENEIAKEAFSITQLKVIQKIINIPIETELNDFETNIKRFAIFIREFEPIIKAFSYIFPNASKLCN